jgi:hypothetical protein
MTSAAQRMASIFANPTHVPMHVLKFASDFQILSALALLNSGKFKKKAALVIRT